MGGGRKHRAPNGATFESEPEGQIPSSCHLMPQVLASEHSQQPIKPENKRGLQGTVIAAVKVPQQESPLRAVSIGVDLSSQTTNRRAENGETLPKYRSTFGYRGGVCENRAVFCAHSPF